MKRSRGDSARLSVAIGKDFEKLVDTDLQMLIQQQVVGFYAHTEVGYRKKGKFFQPVEAGFADFSGHFRRGAISFAIEAKSRTGDRFGFNEIPEKQVEHLEAVASAGGVSLLALEFRYELPPTGFAIPAPRRFAVPWRKVPWRVAVSARAVYADELAGYELHRPLLASFIWSCQKCRFVWPLPRARCLACGDEKGPTSG